MKVDYADMGNGNLVINTINNYIVMFLPVKSAQRAQVHNMLGMNKSKNTSKSNPVNSV